MRELSHFKFVRGEGSCQVPDSSTFWRPPLAIWPSHGKFLAKRDDRPMTSWRFEPLSEACVGAIGGSSVGGASDPAADLISDRLLKCMVAKEKSASTVDAQNGCSHSPRVAKPSILTAVGFPTDPLTVCQQLHWHICLRAGCIPCKYVRR